VRCTSNNFGLKRCICSLLAAALSLSLTACGNTSYEMPYDSSNNISGYNVLEISNNKVVSGFAEGLCITKDNIFLEDVNMETASSALLCDINEKSVLYAKNPHERLYPASLTKVMTALVAMKYGSMDQTLTATESVYISEAGAVLCGLKPGDRMTLNQALHILLMQSANDVALLIAENIGGTVERFIEMMNEEAKMLGATNTSFANPHGLTDENHYTTAYDLYLMFNEAVTYEKFSEIIQMTSYETAYYDGDGNTKDVSIKTTNRYLRENVEMPQHVTVIGGKTGYTNAAGSCLLLQSRDKNGSPYISVILKAESNDLVYAKMTELLNKINK